MTPADTVARTYARIRAYNDPAVFISLRNEADAIAEAHALAVAGKTHLPLYGIPIAVKDNIDVAGLPTTAACPAFTRHPDTDATVVAKLRSAGAIVIGKTNLDQFATGLVGVRSPYGVPRNPVKDGLVPGGSSSGSAVAVSAGLVPAALGTDTAGSGRVPAMLNNIVGLKPTLGLVSTTGVVPACRTLDCISVFALTTDDAWAVLAAMAGPDPRDPFSRNHRLGVPSAMPPAVRLGVPRAGGRVFFDCSEAARAYDKALTRLERFGAALVEIDIEPFYEAARLLYEGPWVAERYAAVQSLITSAPETMHPVTREIIAAGAWQTAVGAFRAFYRLEELRGIANRTFDYVEGLVLPTAPRTYTLDEVLANPIELNSRLGTYTNFVNLLDLSALSVPAAIADDGTPFGITVVAPAGCDAALASIGRVFHADVGLTLGALDLAHPALPSLPVTPVKDEIAIGVVGAHLSGMPLNGELTALGGRFLEASTTTADYRLFALAGTRPPKPGLLRVATGHGSAVAVEIWAMPAGGFGHFVAGIPAPLSIGTLSLANGQAVKGFLVEAEAVIGARDISSFGGWRAYVGKAKATT